MLNKQQERIRWIDNATGIAILCVIIGHVSDTLTGVIDFQFVYGFHLVVFFLVSGYLFQRKELNTAYVNDKFVILMVPYFYTCLAIILMDIFNAYFFYGEQSSIGITAVIGRDLLRSFFASGAYSTFGFIEIGNRIGAIWFLPAMFFANIIFQWLLGKISDWKRLGLITAAIGLIGILSAKFIWLPFSIQSSMMATFYIWIGYIVKEKQIIEKLKWYHYLMAQIVFILGILGNYSCVSFVIADANDIILSMITGVCGSIVVYWIARHIWSGGIIAYAGRNTLIMLCVHLFSLETLSIWINDWLDACNLQGNERVYVRILIEISVAYCGSIIINFLKEKLIYLRTKAARNSRQEKRDHTVDIVRGILIISMLLGHYSIDSMLYWTIYSCHMVAFIFFSGYFYKRGDNIYYAIIHTFKTLGVPYLFAVVCIFATNYRQWTFDYFLITFRKYIINGVSDPIYFILLLLVCRLLYIGIDAFAKNNLEKWTVVIAISVFGYYLGRCGYWFSWSMDVACYAIIFYHLGAEAHRVKAMDYVKNHHVVYFITTPIWVYMIYAGSMEIAFRNYGQYGLVIIGAVSGIILLYKLGGHICKNYVLLKKILEKCGQYSIYILIVHTAFRMLIDSAVSIRFNSVSACYVVCAIVIQVALALVAAYIMSKIRLCLALGRIKK